MGLETGSTISDLNLSNPVPGDSVSEGDDHIRLLKKVLKNIFPGENGQGFSKPIIATEDELNSLVGISGNVQEILEQLAGGAVNNLFAPKDTVMLFHNQAPPNGWTTVTTYNNHTIRIRATGGEGSGGEDNPINVAFTHTHPTKPHALSNAEMPLHGHAMFVSGTENGSPPVPGFLTPVAAAWDNGSSGQNYTMRQAVGASFEDITVGLTSGSGSSNAHSHGDTEESTFEWKPKYVNAILGKKS